MFLSGTALATGVGTINMQATKPVASAVPLKINAIARLL